MSGASPMKIPPLPTHDACRPRKPLDVDGAFVETAVSIGVFKHPHAAQFFVRTLRIVPHFHYKQAALLVKGNRHRAGNQRLCRHLLDAKGSKNL